MNLGNIIKNAAGRYAGRTRGTTGRTPGAGSYNTPAGRAQALPVAAWQADSPAGLWGC